MSVSEHVEILERGVESWNKWRDRNPKERPDLTEEDFFMMDLSGINFRDTDLYRATFNGTILKQADLSGAFLREAVFIKTDLRNARFNGADLRATVMLKVNLEEADLSGCHIYGMSAWDINENEKTIQSDLIITEVDQPKITVDNIEIAQFIYLLLNNKKIRHVIDTVTSKVVLILGRFSDEQKPNLNAIKNELRNYDRVPVMFDFDKPLSRDSVETIKTLAGMARFIIADITDPRSIPQELESIVKDLPSVPVVPLLRSGEKPWGMFDHIERRPSVLKIFYYDNRNHLLDSLPEKVIAPAEAMVEELRRNNMLA